MKEQTRGKKVPSHLIQWAFWLVIWQLGAWAVGNPLFLPGPLLVGKTICKLASTEEFYLSVILTVARCLAAMAISFILGAIFAYLAYRFKPVRGAVSLPMTFFKAVPVMAVAIYIILLVEANWVGVIVCVVMCMPMVYTNILEGLCQVDEKLTEVCSIYGISGLKYFKLLQLPSVLPYIKAALSLISGISWKAVVAAEVLSIPKHSLGTQMLSAKYYLETPTLFAYIVVIVLLSILLEKAIKKWLCRFQWKAYKNSKVLDISFDSCVHDGLAYSEKSERGGTAPEVFITGGAKDYGEKRILSDIDFSLKPAVVTALCGPSGSGKTTLAGIISGLEELTKGSLVIKPETRVSYLFQEDRLFSWLNVYDNIAMGLAQTDGISRERADERIKELAGKLEIEDALWKMPGELSGGMSHRVALARTFAAGRNLVILDEPFRGLDRELKERIVKKMWHEETFGKTVLLISHSPEDCKTMAGATVDISDICTSETLSAL